MGTFQSISLQFDYLPLLVVVGLAWLIPMALSVLKIKRVPSVIVEIFLGYFVASHLLQGADQRLTRRLVPLFGAPVPGSPFETTLTQSASLPL